MAIVLLVAATVFSDALGAVVGVPVLVPILNTLAAFPFMVVALRRGDLKAAIARMIVWALAMGACATLWSYVRPAQTDALFIRGASYRTEMFTWVLPGHGAESTPLLFIPQQLGHAALLCLLADIVLKAALAPWWQRMLLHIVGW